MLRRVLPRASRPPSNATRRTSTPRRSTPTSPRGYYFTKKYGDLHGIYIFSNDTKIGHDFQFAAIGGLRDLAGVGKGIHSDARLRHVRCRQQPAFTPIVRAIKANNSNFAECAVQYSCTVLLRNEAALQGITNQVKVWDCSACYDKKFLQSGGANVEHEYVDPLSLPFYDPREQKANPMLANFVQLHGYGQR